MSEPASTDIALLTAAVRSSVADMAVYASVLLEDLKDALPAQDVSVRRAPTLRQRLRGEPGRVVAVGLQVGRDRFLLQCPRPDAVPTARIEHVVNGIVLDSAETELDAWSQRLAVGLQEQAARSDRARAALARLVLPGSP